MRQIKHMTIRVLMLFYLSSSFLSASHTHHDKLKKQNDCKICLIVKNLDSANISFALPNNTNHNSYKKPLLICHLISLLKEKGFNANAPPLFS